MIQIKRGSTEAWQNNKEKLAAGQPAYDKTRRKLRIGDGTKTFNELKDVSGLYKDEILAEYTPREPTGNVLIDAIKLLTDPDPVFTYGDKTPEEVDRGEIYFQKYDGAVEADYIVAYGRNNNYFYRKWLTGFIECWGNGDSTAAKEAAGFNKIIYETKTGNYFEIKGYWKD